MHRHDDCGRSDSCLWKNEGNIMSDLSTIRRQYGTLGLEDNQLPESPFELFQAWLDEALMVETVDVTAMVLSTVE